ncbi:MAG: cytochrome c biogenesis protein ResB [Bdellovibrionales bacterium]|nr:cytochrome c biogenesis protein ResB [Bdellovibrionales bacterium]
MDSMNLNKTVFSPRKIIKQLASLKLAVITISMIAILTAIGTFVEARYDATAAQKLVYQSIWMELVMGIFAINLTAVIVDRYPWKQRHLAFICAHVGILVVLFGQYLSNNYGLDGSVRVGVGESNNFAVIPGKIDLTVYSSFDGSSYTKLLAREVDFFLSPPTSNKPVIIPTDQGEIRLTEYQKYVVPSRKVVASDQVRAGAGLRFQMHNDKVNVVEWLVQRNPNHVATHDFGPAQIHLGPVPSEGSGKNEIYLFPDESLSGKIRYAVFKKENKLAALSGVVEEGGTVTPGWMGLELRILRYFPRAVETWELKPKDRPTPLTTGAVKVEFQKQEHWLLLNDTLKLFTEKAAYIVTYASRREDLGFPIKLDKFIMDRYQGTMRAASYRSQVTVPEVGAVEISMNEPLKYKGLTIYQASFEDSPQGEPVASVFSVNRDPGRVLKYLGSLIMTLGIILLFYFRKKAQVAKKNEVQG